MVQEQKTYKGVKLNETITESVVRFVINNYGQKTSTYMANVLNLPNRQCIAGVVRQLGNNNVIVVKKAVANKSRKTKVSNPFGNFDGTNKQIARKLMCDAVCSFTTHPTNVLTLPANEWRIEKLIVEHFSRVKFHAVERDFNVYSDMLKNLTKSVKLMKSVNRITNSPMGEVISNSKANDYTHAVLDYCGCVDTFYAEIKHLIDNDIIQKDGTISITLSKAIRTINRETSISKQLLESVGLTYENNTEKESSEISDTLIKFLIFSTNGKYRLEKIFNYQDTKTPMCLYIIKRIK